MSMTDDGRQAEHMTKGELVKTFRELQGWYNTMKVAIDELEADYKELQTAYQEAVNLNLTMQQRAKNQDKLLLNEVTSNNEKNQMLLKRIELLQIALYEMRKE